MIKLIPLQELYEQYKQKFNRTAIHPHPSELLALLLLPEKDKFIESNNNSIEFYTKNEELIREKMEQVIIDFGITKEEINNYITQKGIVPKDNIDYEIHKIWSVFANGFNVVRWGNIHRPNWSPERVYNDFSIFWGKSQIPEHLIEEPIKEIPQTKKRILNANIKI